MNQKALYILAAAVVLSGCDNGSDVNCGDGQKAYQGECYDQDACTPPCDAQTQKCYQGACYDLNTCMPACDEATKKCAGGRCIGLDECYPDCGDDETCVSGKCEPLDKTRCEGNLCNDITTYCDDTGHWKKCEAGYGCHLGYCIMGLAPECEKYTCSENNERCDGGTWVACGSLETCVDGACEFSGDASCEAGSCSEDGSYRCTENGVYEACPSGSVCDAGECRNRTDEAKLWQLCTSNSDCARGICVFEIATSRTMSKAEFGLRDVDSIPVTMLDTRIPTGSGICSQDCTRDESICDTISSGNLKYTCQVVVVGDSPYPPKDENNVALDLPFHRALNVEAMDISPFASICRPNDVSEKTYSKHFCESCTDSSTCGSQESCVYGMCLPKCTNDDMCPLGFSCIQKQDTETSFCVPNSGACGPCLDRDGDGQGHGACTLKGYDCDDLRNDVYYKKELNPASCTENYTDDNCNGEIDMLELLGAEDNCEKCGSPCKVADNAEHFERQCVLDNGGNELDDSSPVTIADTYIYACEDHCEFGYADCDGDLANGCETKLFDVQDSNVVMTEDGVMFSLDSDHDGHGSLQEHSVHFCCKAAEDVCYARPEADTNKKPYWNRAELNPDAQYSTVVDDCDDANEHIYPGHKEICDGFDNDCNASTPDGKDEFVKLDNYAYLPTDEADEAKIAFGAKCTVYQGNSHSVCSENGAISCQGIPKEDGIAYQMVCKADVDSSQKDDTCNNIDDNCNGLIDEDYVFTGCDTEKEGICKMGVKVCQAGKEVCQSLYDPRVYDFYGDGVDSNCDGVDWDKAHTVFIEDYRNSQYYGHDTHSGHYDNPVASLSKAFTLAKETDNGKTLYHDIIVSQNASIHEGNDDAMWGREPIRIPLVSVTKRYNPNLKAAVDISDTLNAETSVYEDYRSAHVVAYQKKLQGDEAYIDYSPNNYLYPKEVYPGKAVIRVYGGFNQSKGTWAFNDNLPQNTKYEYKLTTTDANNLIEQVANSNPKAYMLTKNSIELIRPEDVAGVPMSVAFSHFNFSIGTSDSIYAKSTGTTLIGLTCGKAGCDHLEMYASKIDVKAPTGVRQDTVLPSNDNWENDRNGVNGGSYRTDEGTNGKSGTSYAKNYSSKVCLSKYYKSKIWNLADSEEYNHFVCPDGDIPLGGCGGIDCCKGKCGFEPSTKGLDGGGSNGGGGANVTSAVKKGCGSKDAVDPSIARGKTGNHGAGGEAGVNTGLSIKPYVDKNANLYIATYNGNNKDDISTANGKPGKSGGGGGGGAVYWCWNNSKSAWGQYWMHAGVGGAGGCGGYGGKAGGTGGSAIGMVVTPPVGMEKGYFDVDATLIIVGAQGGLGNVGQSGQGGGKGGMSYGYAHEPALTDAHCMKATAGGAGGAGGGGGSGAGGLAGHAYGYVFMCNRNADFSSIDDVGNCGFDISSAFENSIDSKTTVEAKNDLSDGKAGKAGSWSSDGMEGVDEDANKMSSGGGGGDLGTGDKDTGKHAELFMLIKATF